jgi:integrase
LRAWLGAGPVDRSVGDGPAFVASAASAPLGKGSWILRFRFGGRPNELAVWLLLALCVRKMALFSARWSDFDLAAGVGHLRSSQTKTQAAIDIPLAPPVIEWLNMR